MENSATLNPGATIDTTSLVVLYDGTALGNITLPASPSLNDVLLAVNGAIGDLQAIVGTTKTSQITLYDGTSTVGSVTITSASDLNSVVSQLATYISENIVAITAGGSSIPADGSSSYSLPAHDSSSRPTLTGVNPAVLPVEGYTGPLSPSIDTKPYDPTDANIAGHLSGLSTKLTFVDLNVNERTDFEYVRNTLSGLFDNFTSVKGTLTYGSGSLTTAIAKSNYYISGRRVYVAASSPLMIATSDNYLDVTYAGVYVVTAVSVGADEPALAANSQRLYKITADGSGVTAVVDEVNIYPISNAYIKDNAILTRNITDANVTNAKLDATAVTPATYTLPILAINQQGRVTGASNGAALTSLVNKDILWYSSGSSKFVNVPYMGNIIPTGSDQDVYVYDSGTGLIVAKALSVLLLAAEATSVITQVTTQFDKTADVTLAAITGLTATLTAGATYIFRITLYINADATGGYSVSVYGGTATATTFVKTIKSFDQDTITSVYHSRDNDISANFNESRTATKYECKLEGTIKVNAGGTFIPKFAQHSSNLTSSVMVGSIMEIKRIA